MKRKHPTSSRDAACRVSRGAALPVSTETGHAPSLPIEPERYEFAERRFGLVCTMVKRVLLGPLYVLLRPWRHGKHIRACMRGIWHGVTGNIAARY